MLKYDIFTEAYMRLTHDCRALIIFIKYFVTFLILSAVAGASMSNHLESPLSSLAYPIASFIKLASVNFAGWIKSISFSLYNREISAFPLSHKDSAEY